MATIVVCDVCGSKIGVTKKCFAIGTQPDVAGGPSETVFEEFDLCTQHLIHVLEHMLSQYMYDKNNDFLINKEAVNRIKELINRD